MGPQHGAAPSLPGGGQARVVTGTARPETRGRGGRPGGLSAGLRTCGSKSAMALGSRRVASGAADGPVSEPVDGAGAAPTEHRAPGTFLPVVGAPLPPPVSRGPALAW